MGRSLHRLHQASLKSATTRGYCRTSIRWVANSPAASIQSLVRLCRQPNVIVITFFIANLDACFLCPVHDFCSLFQMSILRRLTGSSVARVARLETRALFSTAASSTATTTTAFPKVGDFMSELSARRQPSPTRTLIPLMKIPGMISLGTGLPNARCVRLHSTLSPSACVVKLC